MEITASDGKKYKTNFYNLEAIISVGYRVNSKKFHILLKTFLKLVNWIKIQLSKKF
jgi:hypothetical protein